MIMRMQKEPLTLHLSKDNHEEKFVPKSHLIGFVVKASNHIKVVKNELSASPGAVRFEGNYHGRRIRVAAYTHIDAVFAGCSTLHQVIWKSHDAVDTPH